MSRLIDFVVDKYGWSTTGTGRPKRGQHWASHSITSDLGFPAPPRTEPYGILHPSGCSPMTVRVRATLTPVRFQPLVESSCRWSAAIDLGWRSCGRHRLFSLGSRVSDRTFAGRRIIAMLCRCGSWSSSSARG